MIILASDHAGLWLKEEIKKYLVKKGENIVDVGPFEEDPKDSYAIYTDQAMRRLQENKDAKAIVMCGTGMGVNIMCNRYKGVYAVVGITVDQVALARLHNNVNVLNLGGRVLTATKAKKLVDAFLTSPFEGGRHIKRIKQIDELSSK